MLHAQNTLISLDISDVPDGTVFKLLVVGAQEDEPPIATARITAGKLHFAFDSQEPRFYDIRCDQPWGNIRLVATKGDHVRVYAVGHRYDNRGTAIIQFSPVQIKGSLLQTEYEEKVAGQSVLNDHYTRMTETHKDFLAQLTKVRRGTPEFDALFNSDAGQRYQAAEKSFFDEVRQYYRQLFLDNRTSWWGPALVVVSLNGTNEELQDIYRQFTPEVRRSFYGTRLAKMLRLDADGNSTKLQVGQTIPDFAFTDHATQQATTMRARMAGKKYVLLDFWASWCGPCRREMPNFKAQYARYKDKGFDIVSISADDREADWLKALEEEQTPWANGLDRNKDIRQLYQVEYYPTVYLVDADGKILAKDEDARGEKLVARLHDLLGE
jgi:thiol-disulfide isomerase/thioredoxin